MLKLNKILGIDVAKENVLVTLEDGRCALVDLKERKFVVEILLDSFYKWMEFYEVDKDYGKEVLDILNNPKDNFFGPKANEYITEKKVKESYDKLKKKFNYNY